MGFLGADSIVLYYERFVRTKTVTNQTACATFTSDFTRRYGHRHYVAPFLILIALTIALEYAGRQTQRA